MSLGVEQRKRLTIGVELAAKPSLLLFLDEPTSGLDSQSAYSIVRFLKKLSQAGQAIVCTIHQPSSQLIQQFDKILALNPGGNTFYFGPVGDHGSAVIDYFAARGTQCPPGKNVAEFILETAAKGGTRGKDGKRINWNKEWLNSEESKALVQKIAEIKAERSKKPPPERTTYAFATPVYLQTIELTKRTFIQQWRDPSYVYGKLFTAVIVGIFNGFTFYKLGDSVASLQSRLFTPFLILLIPPTVVNAVVPRFYQNRALWEAREHPSRIYGWFAFCTAQIVTEIPVAVISAVVYWLLWYYPTGLPRDSSTAGYVFLMTLLFFFFMNSWGQWVCAFAPSFTVISNVSLLHAPQLAKVSSTDMLTRFCLSSSSWSPYLTESYVHTPVFRSFGVTGCTTSILPHIGLAGCSLQSWPINPSTALQVNQRSSTLRRIRRADNMRVVL